MGDTVLSVHQSNLRGNSREPPRRLVSRACDRCKVRKIKCSGDQPCRQCRDSASTCAYLITNKVRGPRGGLCLTLRSHHDNNQPRIFNNAEGPSSESNTRLEATGPSRHPATPNVTENRRYRLSVHDMAAQLRRFNLRLAVIWPIVDVEHLIIKLQQSDDVEYRALATAITAATMSQLNFSIYRADRRYNADQAAAECHEYCSQSSAWKSPNLNTLRIRFFLHAYHENIQPGSSESLLYLREAITLAQVLGLHEESSYCPWLSEEDAHLRRAVFWLLFITERGICVLHRLPVVLHSSLILPQIQSTLPHVTPAFLELVGVISMIDKAGFYVLMQRQHFTWQDLQTRNGLIDLDIELKRLCPSLDGSTAAQRADIQATISWIRSAIYHHLQDVHGCQPQHLIEILQNADSLASGLSSLPASAVEANGSGIQLKIFRLAKSTITSFNQTPMEHVGSETVSQLNKVVRDIYRLLSSNESGNRSLLGELFDIVAEAYGNIALNRFGVQSQWNWGWSNSNLQSPDAIQLGEAQDMRPALELSGEELWTHDMFQNILMEEESHITNDTIIPTNSPILEI